MLKLSHLITHAFNQPLPPPPPLTSVPSVARLFHLPFLINVLRKRPLDPRSEVHFVRRPHPAAGCRSLACILVFVVEQREDFTAGEIHWKIHSSGCLFRLKSTWMFKFSVMKWKHRLMIYQYSNYPSFHCCLMNWLPQNELWLLIFPEEFLWQEVIFPNSVVNRGLNVLGFHTHTFGYSTSPQWCTGDELPLS